MNPLVVLPTILDLSYSLIRFSDPETNNYPDGKGNGFVDPLKFEEITKKPICLMFNCRRYTCSVLYQEEDTRDFQIDERTP